MTMATSRIADHKRTWMMTPINRIHFKDYSTELLGWLVGELNFGSFLTM